MSIRKQIIQIIFFPLSVFSFLLSSEPVPKYINTIKFVYIYSKDIYIYIYKEKTIYILDFFKIYIFYRLG
jgi:hypothetical protein